MHLFAFVLAIVLPQGVTAHDGPFTCTVPIINPRSTPTSPPGGKLQLGSLLAQADLLISGTLRSDFEAAATFTLPERSDNQGLFYSNWALLRANKKGAFVQLELMRWQKYDYRAEIGLTWQLESGRLIYRDTGVFVSDSPHRLGIGVKDGAIFFKVDGQQICSAPYDVFFTNTDRLYYTFGSEVSHVGDRPTGTVSDIQLKTDSDRALRSVAPNCAYGIFGLSWEPASTPGTFAASGVLDPTQPFKFNDGSSRKACNV